MAHMFSAARLGIRTSPFTYAYQVYDYLLPDQAHRIQATTDDIPLLITPVALFLVMCYLVRRTKTRLLRLALGPLIATGLIRATFAYRHFPQNQPMLNFQTSVAGCLLIARCFEFTLTKEGRKLTSEVAPGVPREVAEREKKQKASWFQSLLTGVSDAFSLAFNIRGIGYDFGTGSGLQLPQSTLVFRDKPSWIRSLLIRIFLKELAVDILTNFIRSLPGVGSLQGRSIFLSELSMVPRYTLSTVAHLAIGLNIITGLSSSYDLFTLLGTCVFSMPPSDFPAVFGQPWSATSLHRFWAVEWHQYLRRTFLFYLGYPLGDVFGSIGLVFGAFLASGLFHNFILWGATSEGIAWETIAWFLAQPFALFAERIFYRVTGKRVSGTWGRIWVWTWLIASGQLTTDAWSRLGLFGREYPILTPLTWVEFILGYIKTAANYLS